MTDWLTIDKKTIFEGKDKNGNRYLTEFLKDYKEKYNPQEINAGCSRCLNDYYKKIIKFYSAMAKQETKKAKAKSKFVLKPMFNGIPLKFGSRTLVSNSNLTDELAKELIKNHPRGEALFSSLGETKTEPDYKSLIPKWPKALKGSEARKKFCEDNQILVDGKKNVDYDKAIEAWAKAKTEKGE